MSADEENLRYILTSRNYGVPCRNEGNLYYKISEVWSNNFLEVFYRVIYSIHVSLYFTLTTSILSNICDSRKGKR